MRDFTAQVETLLKTQDPNEPMTEPVPPVAYSNALQASYAMQGGFDSTEQGANFSLGPDPQGLFDPQPLFDDAAPQILEPLPLSGGLAGTVPLTWEMIGLGIDEPLPPQDVIDEL
jgi:hypothetical protein